MLLEHSLSLCCATCVDAWCNLWCYLLLIISEQLNLWSRMLRGREIVKTQADKHSDRSVFHKKVHGWIKKNVLGKALVLWHTVYIYADSSGSSNKWLTCLTKVKRRDGKKDNSFFTSVTSVSRHSAHPQLLTEVLMLSPYDLIQWQALSMSLQWEYLPVSLKQDGSDIKHCLSSLNTDK